MPTERSKEPSTIKEIIVVGYDAAWPEIFESLRLPVAKALDGLALDIHHVGSTSVPGLHAKPIIDMDVVIPGRSDLAEAISRLSTLGYIHRGDLGIPEREAFYSPPGTPTHHLYVCHSASRELARHLAFRNHLRANREDASRYAEIKLDLAARFRYDIDSYVEGKSDFVQSILQKAEGY